MDAQIHIEAIRQTKHFAVSRERYNLSSLVNWFVDSPIGMPENWLIPCTHIFHKPATEAQIVAIASELGRELPVELNDFLRLTNGAELFRLHYRPGKSSYWVARYKILNCSELVQVDQEILETFRSYAEFDEKCRDLERLNYLAFCDVGDGNYLAISLEGTNTGHVFFLDHGYGFYPYMDESTRDAYAYVADSLGQWLERLVQSEGQDGMGNRWIPL